jgi:hypothetical protein
VKLAASDSTYGIRVGNDRVIYEVLDRLLVVDVIRIGHRREVDRWRNPIHLRQAPPFLRRGVPASLDAPLVHRGHLQVAGKRSLRSQRRWERIVFRWQWEP